MTTGFPDKDQNPSPGTHTAIRISLTLTEPKVKQLEPGEPGLHTRWGSGQSCRLEENTLPCLLFLRAASGTSATSRISATALPTLISHTALFSHCLVQGEAHSSKTVLSCNWGFKTFSSCRNGTERWCVPIITQLLPVVTYYMIVVPDQNQETDVGTIQWSRLQTLLGFCEFSYKWFFKIIIKLINLAVLAHPFLKFPVLSQQFIF